MKKLQRQKGFTLVELAIVLTIIGLLIGGILKGQQLIANARVTSQMSQVQGIDAATTTFRDTYAGMPGDLATPSLRVPGCTATPCSTAGDANGRIGASYTVQTAVPTYTDTENRAFWTQLSAANLVSGITVNGGTTFGAGYPNAKIGTGGFLAGTAGDGFLYLVNVTDITQITGATGTGPMSPAQAAQLDRKMDDGIPASGSVLSAGSACVTSAIYNETSATKDCGQFYRIQQ